MHEFGYAEALLRSVERRARRRPVRRIRVCAGVLHRLDRASLAQAFGFVAAGTVAADAEIDLVGLPVVTRCRSCGARGESTDPLPACGRCGGVDVELAGGDEFVLESIEVEVPAGTPAEDVGARPPGM